MRPTEQSMVEVRQALQRIQARLAEGAGGPSGRPRWTVVLHAAGEGEFQQADFGQLVITFGFFYGDDPKHYPVRLPKITPESAGLMVGVKNPARNFCDDIETFNWEAQGCGGLHYIPEIRPADGDTFDAGQVVFPRQDRFYWQPAFIFVSDGINKWHAIWKFEFGAGA